MTTDELKAKVQEMAEKGIDARTITVNFESVLGRPLNPAESDAVIDGWRAAAPARAERYRRQGQQAADEVAARRA